jgi:hypothetical protein
VRLFADRVRLVDARFVLDGQTGPAVAALVRRLDGMPLAIELAAARVEALGVAQMLDRLDDRFALLGPGQRLAASRHRSLAAAVEWSYRLLDDSERRVFRAVSVFPGPFTLQAAEAVAGPDAGPVVLRLVDCSLLVPPRPGSDGRYRYAMLETLRAYGARLLAEAGEAGRAARALAGYALGASGRAAAGLQTTTGEAAAARWLDAEDATMRQVLAWATGHDAAMALRLAAALAPWWHLRGRLPGQYPLLREAAGRAERGGDAWCTAQFWLGLTAVWSADPVAALGHFTAVRDAIGDQGTSRALSDCLAGRSLALAGLHRAGEAGDGRRALALARETGDPAAEALALVLSAIVALEAGDSGGGAELARQARQVTADIPGWMARASGSILTEALIGVGTWPLPSAAARSRWPWPGTRATWGPCRGCWSGWRPWTCGRAASKRPGPGCAKRSRSPRRATARQRCLPAWTAAGTCAPPPGGPPRPPRCGRRSTRWSGTRGSPAACWTNAWPRSGTPSGPPGRARPGTAARR